MYKLSKWFELYQWDVLANTSLKTSLNDGGLIKDGGLFMAWFLSPKLLRAHGSVLNEKKWPTHARKQLHHLQRTARILHCSLD